jgi:hypothetical protein
MKWSLNTEVVATSGGSGYVTILGVGLVHVAVALVL